MSLPNHDAYPPVSVDMEHLQQLTQAGPAEWDPNVFTGDAFYRYPERFDMLEAHMREHIQSGAGNYYALSVGASTGKEAISMAISWAEAAQASEPYSAGNIGILALEANAGTIEVFNGNVFPVYEGRDLCVDRVVRYASAVETPNPAVPSFIAPLCRVSIVDAIRESITYVHMDAESPAVAQLPKVFGVEAFNAVVCHTASRYFADEAMSMRRIAGTVHSGGLFSHIS